MPRCGPRRTGRTGAASTGDRRAFHVRQHAFGHQGAVGVLIEPAQGVHQQPIKKLEHHQLGPDVDVQIGACFANAATDNLRAERHLAVLKGNVRYQMTDPNGQQTNGFSVPVTQFVNQVIDRNLLFQFIVIHQTQAVLIQSIQRAAGIAGRETAKVIECPTHVLKYRQHHRLAPQPQFPHGVEIRGLIHVGAGAVGQLEQGVVRLVKGVAENRFERLSRCVTETDKHRRQRETV